MRSVAWRNEDDLGRKACLDEDIFANLCAVRLACFDVVRAGGQAEYDGLVGSQRTVTSAVDVELAVIESGPDFHLDGNRRIGVRRRRFPSR